MLMTLNYTFYANNNTALLIKQAGSEKQSEENYMLGNSSSHMFCRFAQYIILSI